MKDYNHEEVTRLLHEMEVCVNRIKALCQDLKAGWGEG